MAEADGLEAAIAAGNEKELTVRHGIKARLYINDRRLDRLRRVHGYFKRTLEQNRARLEFSLENLERVNAEWVQRRNELLEDPDNPNLEEDMRNHSEALRIRMNDVANSVAELPDQDNHDL